MLFCSAVNYAVPGSLTFESVDEILNVIIQMKSLEQYFSVVLLIMRYLVV